MDEMTANLVREFNFKPKHIFKQKYMFICKTDKGTKMIRAVNQSTDKILFVHNVKEYLISTGFLELDKYYLSVDGNPYVINDDTIYVMTDYINFEECDLSCEVHLKKTIELLANFHKMVQGFNYNIDFDQIEFLDLASIFEKKINNLKKMKKLVSKQKNLTDFELRFIKNYDYFYKKASMSLDIILKHNYQAINKLARKSNMLCYNRPKEDAIFVGDKAYLTQMENIDLNHFIYDLARFLVRYIKKHNNNNTNLEEILTTYSKINYIDGSLLPILYALIVFPDRYIQTCQSFFERKRSFTPICISSQMDNIISLIEFEEAFLKKIKPK